MNKLISADVPRVLRSKITYIILLLVAFMAAASVFTTAIETDDRSMLFAVSSNNLSLFMGLMAPVFAGGLSIMLIATEFSSGVIRNKFVMGHRRSSILFSWCVIYSATTLLTFAVYIGTYFASLAAFGADLSSADAGNVAVNLLTLLLFSMKFQMFCFLMVCIYPDAKTAVIVYILNNITMVPLMLASMSDEKSKAVRFLSRIFIFGFTAGDFTLLDEPDKPWLTAILITALAVIYFILALAYFRRKDLK